jgi:hypothetical protein
MSRQDRWSSIGSRESITKGRGPSQALGLCNTSKHHECMVDGVQSFKSELVLVCRGEEGRGQSVHLAYLNRPLMRKAS